MKLSMRQKASYGLGAVGKDIVYMLIANYLLYYYDVVLKVSPAFIGTVMMAARIFDALNDPFMGIVVAKTKTRWGKFRPWILTGTVLNAVTIYALFATPGSLSQGGMKVWLVIFYLAWGITYTLMDIPFWSMIPAITEVGKERENLSALARACSGFGSAIPTVLTMVVVPLISGSAVAADYKIGFKWWALIIAVFFVISELICVLNVPERKSVDMEESHGLKDMFGSLLKNDQTMTIVITIVFVYTALNLVGALLLYFFQFDVGNTGAYNIFVGVSFAAQVIAMMIFPLFRKKFSKIKLFVSGIVLQIIGFGLLLLISSTNIYHTTSWIILCIPGILVYTGFGLLNVLLTIFLSDSVDYGEIKNGARNESVIFSMQTFTVKLAAGIAIFVAGLSLDFINLDKEASIQSASTLSGLRIMMSVPSIVLLIIAIIVFKRFYKLDENRIKDIKNKLEDKRKNQQ